MADDRLNRIAGFSDAIFAFAMTLLVLSIKSPDIPDNISTGEFHSWLVAQIPNIFACVLSFAVIGSFWISHHKMFSHIKKYDDMLIWMNMAFLLVISLLPFPTAVLAEYGHESAAVILYAGSMAVAGILLSSIWHYASLNRRLIERSLSKSAIETSTKRGLGVSFVFLISIPIAAVSPILGMATWILAVFVKLAVR